MTRARTTVTGRNLLLSALAMVLVGALAAPTLAGGRSHCRSSYRGHHRTYHHVWQSYQRPFGHSRHAVRHHWNSGYRSWLRHRSYAACRSSAYRGDAVGARGGYAPARYGGMRPSYGGSKWFSYDRLPYGAASTDPTRCHVVRADERVDAERTAPRGLAWDALRQGDTAEALVRFAREASRHRTQGAPKIGFALAAALGHDDALSVWAMRKALEVDAEALCRIELDETLTGQVDALIDRFLTHAEKRSDEAQALFMVAALSTLRDDVETASMALARAAEAGDDTDSAAALAEVLAAAVETDPVPGDPAEDEPTTASDTTDVLEAGLAAAP